MADLYTFTLTDGSGLQWTDSDRTIRVGDRVFLANGALIERTGIKLTRGIETRTLSVTLTPTADVTVAGRALAPFVVRGGFDGADVLLERAFLTLAGDLVVTVVRFRGRVGPIDDATADEIPLTVVSRTHVLDTAMPADLYQRGCLNTLFDHACGLNRADFAVDGVVMGTPTDRAFGTDLAAGAGYFTLGRILIGGVLRSIRTHEAGGHLTLSLPLPAVPSAGTPFIAWPGCDGQQATCENKFNNNRGSGRNRFRGQPYIPVVETAV